MALPTRDQILTGEYSLDGSPGIAVAAKSGIDLDSLEYSLDGSPWWGAEVSGAGPTENIKTIGQAIVTAIVKIGGIVWSGIKKIGGVARI